MTAQLLKCGDVRPIAAAIADKRLPTLPEWPTAAETVPDIDFGGLSRRFCSGPYIIG